MSARRTDPSGPNDLSCERGRDSGHWQRVDEIFNALIETPSEERLARLNALAGGDASLRAEVARLLESDGRVASQFLEPPAVLAAAGPDVRPTGERPGTVIGSYTLQEQVGEGGFGVVYLAEQHKPVRRRVALKIIKPGMDTKQVIGRFQAERQALALMDHPNIAHVLDGGETDSGRPYFVMELVKGIPITDYCDQSNLTTRQRLDLFVLVCQAVQHAHQKGIIHRDLKPSNVMIAMQDGQPAPKVIDFGVAKAINQRLTEHTLHTQFAQMVGTPLYMSPEQAEMSPLEVDTRSDIYSLGAMLYELLTGTTPFERERLKDASFDELRQIIRHAEPPKPSTRLSTLGERASAIARHRRTDAHRLQQLVRGDLDWIVMKALEKDRTRRYETANALSMDLQRHLSGEPVVAAPPSGWYRTAKFMRRNKAFVLAAGVVAAALFTGLGVSTWMYFRERAAHARAVSAELVQVQLRSQAEADEKRARSEAAKSRQVAQFMKDMLKGVEPSVALGRDTTMLREILDHTAQRVDKDLKDQPEVQIELRLTLADTYHELSLYKEMEEMARETLALAQSTFGEENLAVAIALGQVADAVGHLSRYEEGLPFSHKSIAMMRKLRGADSLEEASALYHLAFGLGRQGKRTEAEAAARAALAMRRKLLGPEHPEVARSLDGLSRMLMADQKLVEAEAAARESLDMRRKLLGNENPELGRSLDILGAVLRREGKHAEAEELYRQLLPGLRKTMGEHHPLVGRGYGSLADALRGLERHDEAEQALRESIALLNRALVAFPDQRPSLLETQAHNHRYLAFRAWGQRNHSGARELFGIATDLFRQAAAGGAPREIATALQGEADDYLCIAQLWEAESRGAEAKAAYRQALALHERMEEEDRAPDITAGWVANHYIQLGQLVEKVATREDVLRITRILHAPNQVLAVDAMTGLVNCRVQLATVLQRHGRTHEAIQQLQDAAAGCRESIVRMKASPGGDVPGVANALHKLGDVLRDADKWNEAEEAFREAVAMRRNLFGAEHLDLAHSLHGLAWVVNHNGKPDEAEALSREELAMRRRLLGNEHPDVATTLEDLALFLRDQGRLPEAEAAARECLSIRERAMPDGFLTHSARSLLGGYLFAQGNLLESESLLLSGYDGMTRNADQVPPYCGSCLKESVKRLVSLYEQWDATEPNAGYDAKAAEWRAKLDLTEAPTPASQQASP